MYAYLTLFIINSTLQPLPCRQLLLFVLLLLTLLPPFALLPHFICKHSVAPHSFSSKFHSIRIVASHQSHRISICSQFPRLAFAQSSIPWGCTSPAPWHARTVLPTSLIQIFVLFFFIECLAIIIIITRLVVLERMPVAYIQNFK